MNDIDGIGEHARRMVADSAERREDRAYYDGARQAAAMAHQSLKAMDEWIADGCGGRGPSARPPVCNYCKALEFANAIMHHPSCPRPRTAP